MVQSHINPNFGFGTKALIASISQCEIGWIMSRKEKLEK